MDRLRALVLAVVGVVGLVLLIPLPASAAAPAARPATALPAPNAPVPAGARPATILGAYHTCQRFGAIVKDNVAAHCADIDEIPNNGYLAVRGRGQAWCLRDSTAAATKCTGIVQSIIIRDLDEGGQGSPAPGNVRCGSYGGSACPAADRFSNVSTPILVFCDHRYQTTVRTTLVLPSSLGTSRSLDWKSGIWKFTPCS